MSGSILRNGEKMKENRSYLTPKECADLAGVTTRTINNYITSGKLSATREDNRYYIDKSEFYRVFPECITRKNMRNDEKFLENIEEISSLIEIRYLKEALLDKEKQNDFLKQVIDGFSTEKSLMLQTINTHSRMLEHKQEKEEQDIILAKEESKNAKPSNLKESILNLFKRR